MFVGLIECSLITLLSQLRNAWRTVSAHEKKRKKEHEDGFDLSFYQKNSSEWRTT